MLLCFTFSVVCVYYPESDHSNCPCNYFNLFDKMLPTHQQHQMALMSAAAAVGQIAPGGLNTVNPGGSGGLVGPLTPLSVDPATNDAPLDFNAAASATRTSCVRSVSDDGRQRETNLRPFRRRSKERSSPESNNTNRMPSTTTTRFNVNDRNEQLVLDRNSPVTVGYMDSTGLPGTSSSLPLESVQQWGMVYPMLPIGADPNMMTMMPMTFNQFSFMGTTDAALAPMTPIMPLISGGTLKEIIHCKSCTLFPPNPNGPPSTTRERPPGCRTVFVGGLPESITEDIVHEVFDRCGEITTVRMSKKNFCHIRFEIEAYVDNAIFLSGYRIRIGSNTDPPNTGRLHVDYAQARDDLYEWECRQRQMQREHRHRERIEQERLRPPSPPPVVHYNEHEASLLAEKLKAAPNLCAEVIMTEGATTEEGDDTFYKAVQTLVTWLDRGDCTKRNSGQFYGMIQSTNSHVRRLMNEKSQFEDELHRAKEKLRRQVHGILLQFNQIEKVFMTASHQKVWDHFTKAQRKNIDMWKKQAQEIKNAQLEDALNERVEDEMDVSDEDNDSPYKKMKLDGQTLEEQVTSLISKISNLQEENDSLRCQLEAYKNEVDLIKLDNRQEIEDKEKQTRALQQALQGMQQQLIQANQQRMKDEETITSLRKDLDEKKASGDSELRREAKVSTSNASLLEVPSKQQMTINENEAKLIGLLSTFLNVHPFGASVDYIWSYLQRLNSSLRPSDVEALLLKFPNVFKLEFSGVGAMLERKWMFTGFETLNLT